MVVELGSYACRYGTAAAGKVSEPAVARTASGQGPQQPAGKVPRQISGPLCGAGRVDPAALLDMLKDAYAAPKQGQGSPGWRPGEHPLLLVGPPQLPPRARERAAQVVFEQLGVTSFCILDAPAAVLAQQGRSSGVVIDAGESGVSVSPVRDMVPLKYAAGRSPFGGAALTERFCPFLRNALAEREAGGAEGLAPGLEGDLARQLKEKTVHVAATHEDAVKGKPRDALRGWRGGGAKECRLQLPDGTALSLSVPDELRVQAAEPFFAPSKMAQEGSCGAEGLPPGLCGVPELLHSALGKLPVTQARELAGHVALVGGTAAADGFADRVKYGSAEALAPLQLRPLFAHSVQPAEAAWQGAVLLATVPAVADLWRTRGDYDESGPSCVLPR
eukprot:TRINITY_DN47277_c0_g1_i1.p2 TRINITY_DN47277_c0_g1~~TRINITY_DN47277_c0_g1_i1.p2  ORF type:complete len:429 (+),score=147.46 TRINITY_DN47277_c0_g1_i1:122-1288(+)